MTCFSKPCRSCTACSISLILGHSSTNAVTLSTTSKDEVIFVWVWSLETDLRRARDFLVVRDQSTHGLAEIEQAAPTSPPAVSTIGWF